jgi:EAL domain-containing protein (putative c-di-GMP-specific phosphodiesterase class I)
MSDSVVQPPPSHLASGLRCVFQPLVDLASGELLGHEVLARTSSGASPFNAPLTAAARHALERACLERALAQVRVPGGGAEGDLAAAHEGPAGGGAGPAVRSPRLFVNVSPELVCAPDFPALVAAAGPGRLSRVVLELTERDAVADPALLQERLAQLQALGAHIALDDFGAGHSGLLTLVQVMPGFLKLDMGLIRGLHLHPYRQHLVRSLVAFAARVRATLVAEGVETWEELEALLSLGVRHAQGFLLGVPASCTRAPGAHFDEGRRRLLARLPPARRTAACAPASARGGTPARGSARAPRRAS